MTSNIQSCQSSEPLKNQSNKNPDLGLWILFYEHLFFKSFSNFNDFGKRILFSKCMW